MKKGIYVQRIIVFLLATLFTQPVFSQTYTWQQVPFPYACNVTSVASNSNTHIFVGTETCGPYRTTNLGTNWTNLPIPKTWSYAYNLTVDHLSVSTTGIVFILVYDQTSSNLDDGVYRSYNNGDTWEKIFSNPYGNRALTLNPIDHVYVGHGDGVDYSDNNGDSFTYLGPYLNYFCSGLFVNKYGTLFGNFNGFAWLYVNNQWKNFVGILNSGQYDCFGVDYDGRLYSGTHNNGILYSDNDGETWNTHGLVGRKVYDIKISNSNYIYAATDDGIHICTDGVNWNPIIISSTAMYEISLNASNQIIARKASGDIYLGIPDPHLTITYPNQTSISLQQLKDCQIEWDTFGNVGLNVHIDLYKNNVFLENIATSTPNDREYTWFVSRCLVPGSDYSIKITSALNAGVYTIGDPFSIVPSQAIPSPKEYTAYKINNASIPQIDGNLNDAIWNNVPEDTLLFGGTLGDYNADWNAFSDNFVTWKAIWNETNRRIYIAVNIQDDIRGTSDNGSASGNYDPAQDESLEFMTDGDNTCVDYWGQYGPAQYWRVTAENERNLYNYPTTGTHLYSGTDFITAVQLGQNGNWTCEVEFTIYDEYRVTPKTLTVGDVIGFDIWYNDSDDETFTGDYYEMDHQTGWNYQGPVWRKTDYAGSLILGSETGEESIILDVPMAESAPVIDGSMDDTWYSVCSVPMEKPNLIEISAPDNWLECYASFKMMYDADNYYLFIQAHDDVINTSNAFSYYNDSFELFFDGDNSKNDATTGYDANDVQLRYVYGQTTEDIGNAPNSECVFLDTEYGYNLEIRIPTSDMTFNLTPDHIFGFDIAMNDNDTGDREHLLKWWSESLDSWINPSLFGTARTTDYVAAYPMVVLQAPSAPTIDGVADEAAWEDIPWISSNTFADRSDGVLFDPPLDLADVDGWNDCRFNYKMMWEGRMWQGSMLYFYANVFDDVISTSQTDYWMNDCFQIFIDGNNDKTSSNDANDCEYHFVYNKTPTSDLAFTETGFGWTIEAQMDVSVEPGITLADGHLMGLEVHLNDNDGTNREHMTRWWSNDDISWINPSVLGTVEFTGTTVDVDESHNKNSPKTYHLAQNYPNPFNPITTIEFSVPKRSHVTLKIFDIRGREVTELINDQYQTGVYQVEWNAKELPSGLYFYQIDMEDYTAIRKMILLE